jgi:hypothetical protein
MLWESLRPVWSYICCWQQTSSGSRPCSRQSTTAYTVLDIIICISQMLSTLLGDMAAEAAGGGGTPVLPDGSEAKGPQLQPAGNRSACAPNMCVRYLQTDHGLAQYSTVDWHGCRTRDAACLL